MEKYIFATLYCVVLKAITKFSDEITFHNNSKARLANHCGMQEVKGLVAFLAFDVGDIW